MRVKVGMIGLLLVAVLASACWADRTIGVESGTYSALDAMTADGEMIDLAVDRLTIDRDAGKVILSLSDGSSIEAQLSPRPRQSWPSGCPTNVRSTRMEVLGLQVQDLEIGSSTLARPVIVRDCSAGSAGVIIRGDGQIGGGGGACTGAELCLRFCRDGWGAEDALPVDPLPRAMKGYELYSWRSGSRWHYTLTTGTNRLKTLAEVTSCRNTREGDWVKITVTGTADLEDLLAMIPRGSQVIWHGGRGIVADDLGEVLEMPEAEVVAAVRARCAGLGIDLAVGP